MTQAEFVQHGDAIDFTPAVNVAAGEVIIQGDLLGIAKKDIAAGQLGALAVVGVFDVVKPTGKDTQIALGQKVYWDAANQITTLVATDNRLLGHAVLAAGEADAHVRVRLSPA